MPSLLLILIALVPLLLDQPFTITGQEITGKAQIAQTCNKTEYPGDCISTFETDPRSFNVSNVSSLAKIGLEITASKANYYSSFAQILLRNATDYMYWAFIGACAGDYNLSVQYMKDSLKAFDELKYNQSYQSLVSVHNSVIDCQSQRLEAFNDVNAMMSKITKNVMAILHMLF